MKEGLQAAEITVNQRQRGVSGRRLQVQFFDTAGTAAGTMEALQAARAAGAIAVIAGYDTEEVNLIIAHADNLQMPMIIPLATSDFHSNTSAFVYRNCFSDTQQMEVLASYLAFWRQKNTGAIVTDSTDDADYTGGVSRNFSQSVTDLGGAITTNTVLTDGALLTEGQLRSLLMTEPQFILVSARGKRAAQIIKQLREAGFYGIYLPNPYDSLLAYLSTCLYPADVYRRLWGMLRWAKQKEDVVL
jgi:ABC-type branched-subunit amino acid transport system substrate-binding protein